MVFHGSPQSTYSAFFMGWGGLKSYTIQVSEWTRGDYGQMFPTFVTVSFLTLRKPTLLQSLDHFHFVHVTYKIKLWDIFIKSWNQFWHDQFLRTHGNAVEPASRNSPGTEANKKLQSNGQTTKLCEKPGMVSYKASGHLCQGRKMAALGQPVPHSETLLDKKVMLKSKVQA